MVYYKGFFNEFKDWMSLDANEQIVYSAIVNYAVVYESQLWNIEERSICMEGLYDWAKDDDTLDLTVDFLTLDRLAKYCGLSTGSFFGYIM